MSISLCGDEHEEICYEAKNYYSVCPICELIKEKDSEIEKLEDKIDSLETQISDLEDE